ncbi:ATP-binding protein [Kitasatospora sp. NPDC048545]|uniref:ATP-binding protein n=1 Tax=Kitasatospora sp. NPDC048545 TaxID=3157208 RepID=UPI0033CC0755
MAGLWLDAEDVRADRARAPLLVISELVADALEHSDSTHPHRLVARRTADWILLEVRDRGKTSAVPRLHRGTPDDDHGRGLALVADCAQQWGRGSARTATARCEPPSRCPVGAPPRADRSGPVAIRRGRAAH